MPENALSPESSDVIAKKYIKMGKRLKRIRRKATSPWFGMVFFLFCPYLDQKKDGGGGGRIDWFWPSAFFLGVPHTNWRRILAWTRRKDRHCQRKEKGEKMTSNRFGGESRDFWPFSLPKVFCRRVCLCA